MLWEKSDLGCADALCADKLADIRIPILQMSSKILKQTNKCLEKAGERRKSVSSMLIVVSICKSERLFERKVTKKRKM